MFNKEQAQHVLEVVEHCAVGLITTEEMVSKLLRICKETGENVEFMTNAEALGITADIEA